MLHSINAKKYEQAGRPAQPSPVLPCPALPCPAQSWPGQGNVPRVAFAYIPKIVFCAHSYLVRHVLAAAVAVAGAVRVQ